MPERKAQYTITPQMHALMRLQRISALKAEQQERRQKLAREFAREQEDRMLQRYGLVSRDDPLWPIVEKAVSRAVIEDGLDWRNERACRAVADKAVLAYQRKQTREETNVVYYVRVGDYIKIGTTNNINRRMRAYPPGAELLATEPGSYQKETERVEQFAEYHAERREWFHPGERLMAHMWDLTKRQAG